MIGLPMAYYALGQAAESDAALTELIDKHEQGWAYNIAYVLAFRGEADRAFEWLDKAVEYKDSGLSQIPVQVLFANIHDDPRWLPFLESIGKSPEQLGRYRVRGAAAALRGLDLCGLGMVSTCMMVKPVLGPQGPESRHFSPRGGSHGLFSLFKRI